MRKRSSYRPRSILTDPLSLMRPAPKGQRDRVTLTFLSALESMSRGEHPGEDDWRSLSDAINTVETLTLAMGKLKPDQAMPVVNAAIAAMVGAANRFKAGNGMRLDAAGLQAVRDVVDLYGQCLELLPERDMAVAQQKTQQRMDELLRARQPTPEVIAL